MTTTRTAAARPASSTGRRRPASALVAATLTLLSAAVGSYGAVFFSSGDGISNMEANFLLGYLAISAYGVVCALWLLRGAEPGRVGVVFYGAWLLLFNAFHVLFIQDLGALPFGLIGAGIALAAMTPAVRRLTGASGAAGVG